MHNLKRTVLEQYGKMREPDFIARRMSHFYTERVQKMWNGGTITRGKRPGKNAIVLSSNDYLNLAQHRDIKKSIAVAVLEYGNGLLMSPVFFTEDHPQRSLEGKLAKFMHAEDGILCQSGYMANLGLIQTIANEHVPVYIDMFAHTSLWDGIRSAGARAVTVYHNDAAHLERQVKRFGAGIIAVDTIYSATGDICPLSDFVSIAEKYDCVMVADESHALGTHGPNGAGLVPALGLTDRVLFRTASLAKAFVGRAGFITCSSQFAGYFPFEARPSIFSSALLPFEIAALDAALPIIAAADERRAHLSRIAATLRAGLASLGYPVKPSGSQIIPLEAGQEPATLVLRDALEAREVFGSVFCAPATPKNRSLVRLSPHAQLEDAQLERILDVCRDIREEVRLEDWPARQRARNPLFWRKAEGRMTPSANNCSCM